MIDYLIGVDGGGSGTRVRLAHRDGTELAQGRAGPSGLAHGIGSAWAAIDAAVLQAFAAAAILRPALGSIAIGLGLAGAHNRQWGAALLAQNPGYAFIALESDADTTLFSVHQGQPGAVVAVGTGSVGAVLQADGQRREVGGWGFPSGDEGGGAWIGLRAVNFFQQLIDGRADASLLASPLARALSDVCGRNRDALFDWLGRANQTGYAQLAPLVLSHAARDQVAHSIVIEAGQHLAAIAAALDPSGRLPIALCGGLAAPLAIFLPGDLRQRVTLPSADSALGALWLIQNQIKGQLPCQRA